MLADPAFCELAYVIGVASLAADDTQIWHLTKLYWQAPSPAPSCQAPCWRSPARFVAYACAHTPAAHALAAHTAYMQCVVSVCAKVCCVGRQVHCGIWRGAGGRRHQGLWRRRGCPALRPALRAVCTTEGRRAAACMLRHRMQSCVTDGASGRRAGILSSYGEMEHMAQGRAKLLPFDPFAKQPKMSYKVRSMPCLPLLPPCNGDPLASEQNALIYLTCEWANRRGSAFSWLLGP